MVGRVVHAMNNKQHRLLSSPYMVGRVVHAMNNKQHRLLSSPYMVGRVVHAMNNKQHRLLSSPYVTGFAKRGLIHASDFATLMRHNFICSSAIKLKFTVTLV